VHPAGELDQLQAAAYSDGKKLKLDVAPLHERSTVVCVQLDGQQLLRDSSESLLVTGQGDERRSFLLHVSSVCDGILSNSGIVAVAGPGELLL
jgi:hypothetical protein